MKNSQEALDAMRAAIAQAEANASAEFMAQATLAIIDAADDLGVFTADDVQERLGAVGSNPALGPCFLRLQRKGFIAPTGRMVQTRLAQRHRRITEWRRVQ